ncbi:50S ribosomal protein L35 [Lujinxingia litoralis]|uniref:Large ribosomal subunit protein bL35 n=1 Tax=Lujinxingia litoralis TaxID=2211119 RepID=A0A328CB58_9DELT|nr:50S ribosomal protein L35 [Lujinxingia litoralis]RAL25422.1 50S ribosomal protein L35 [Lujinxingia litoralis]
MSKMKTHRGAAKRFKKTKSGKVKYRRGFRAHILTKKSSKRKRHLRKDGYIHPADEPRVKALIGQG